MKLHRTLTPMLALAAFLSLPGCVTEGAREDSARDSATPPVAQAHKAVTERIERMRFEYGKELLASVQALISLRELAKAPILEALPTTDARTRANLIYVLGYIGGPEAHASVRRHSADSDMAVRYEAAAALMQMGDWSSIPVLISFMESPDRRIRYKAFQVLRERTEQDFGYEFNAPEVQRAESVNRWKSWWDGRRREIIYGRNDGAAPTSGAVSASPEAAFR